MSNSASRKRDKTDNTNPRKKRDEDEDAEDGRRYRNTEMTPRVYDSRASTVTTLDHLEDGMADLYVGGGDRNYESKGLPNNSDAQYTSAPNSWSDRKWTTADRDPKGYWPGFTKNNQNELIHDYDTVSGVPNTRNNGMSSQSSYATGGQQDSTSSQSHWQSNYTVASGRSQFQQEQSTMEYTTSSSAGPYSQDSGNVPAYRSTQSSMGFNSSVYESPGNHNRYTVGLNAPDDKWSSFTNSSNSYSQRFAGAELPRMSTYTSLPGSTPPLCRCEDLSDHLCGIIIFPPQERPSDGKIEPDKGKGKGKAGTSSSASGTKSGSGSDRLSVKGPDGAGCGPIVLPGITPSPRPKSPWDGADEEERKQYERQIFKWKEAYDNWKHITCPCRHGYFDEDGKWISGGDVRNQREPPNPRWRSSNGVAPDVRTSKIKKGYKAKLYERASQYQIRSTSFLQSEAQDL